jgi:hypothetical protein
MDDGVIYIEGTRMYKHILFHCENGKRVVQGFLLSSVPEPNPQRQDIMFVVDNDPLLHNINEGWELDSRGNWQPPGVSLVVIKANLECEIQELGHQLHLLKEYEDTAEWLGVVPYSEECNRVLPPPVYHKPEIPQTPKFNNLYEAFQSLVPDETHNLMETGILPMTAGFQQMAAVSTETKNVSTPMPIPPKNELLLILENKYHQLRCECGV